MNGALNLPILNRYEEFWQAAYNGREFVQMAQIIRGMLTFFGDDPDYCDTIEQKAIDLEIWYPLMSLEEFSRCAKTVTYAKHRIGQARGTQFASGLSRQLTDGERAELREPGHESDRFGPESNGSGGEGLRGIITDIRADDSDNS
jgi:hypothetical protein